MKKTSNDLTQGNIAYQIIMFALPIMLGQLFQTLYNSVDAIVVGNFVGTTALAAVSASTDISQLLVGFFTGLSAGSAVLFARYFGAKDYGKLHDSIHTAIAFSIILGVCMAAIGIIFTPQLLTLIDCPEDVFAEAETYLRIYLIGILFTSLYNVGSGVLRAVGDSRSPFIYLVVTSFVNMFLDLLFVVAFKMGVMGVAAATIISQLVSVMLVLRRMLFTEDVYKLTITDLKIDRELLMEVIRLGIPAAFQSCLISISNLFVQRYINSFGSAAMAGIGAAKKIDRFVGLIALSLGHAIASFVSQNVGAKRFDRVDKVIKISLVICAVPVLALGAVVFLNAGWAVGLFTSDANAIYYGSAMIQVMVPLYYFQSINQIYSNVARGFGKSVVVMVLAIMGMVVFRQIFLAIMMNMNWDIHNVYYAYPFGWFCAGAGEFIYYRIVIRKQVKEGIALAKANS